MKSIMITKLNIILILVIAVLSFFLIAQWTTISGREGEGGKPFLRGGSRSEGFLKKPEFAKGGEELFKQGHKFLEEKKLDDAIKEFQECVKLSPKTTVAHYWLGTAYSFKRDAERAIVEFKKTIELEPENYRAHAMLGKMYSFSKDRLDEAIKELNKALILSPDYPEAHFDLARIYALQGNMERSLAEFGYIFSLEAQYPLYHYELGRIFEAMKAADKAKNEYQRALLLSPDLTMAKEALQKLK